jgi:hypothetical protein
MRSNHRFLLVLSAFLPAACGNFASSGVFSSERAPSGPPPSGSGSAPQAGTLTAGTWDDNRNFDFFESYTARTATSVEGAPQITSAEREQAHRDSLVAPGQKQAIDIALMIDTTGSMGDELEWIKVELTAIADSVVQQFSGVDQRWALVVYRDTVDEYLTRDFDFTSDVNRLSQHLKEQIASGGGDYPESPEIGLEHVLHLSWRSGPDVARLIFWIADAPYHTQQEHVMTTGVRGARTAGVHMYPISASGADALLELSMRSAAQLTGGRYLFLTDDSGIGDPHRVPEIPCFFVTKLNKAMERMIAIELSGQYREPDAADILRTGGDPKDGRCHTDQGGEFVVF